MTMYRGLAIGGHSDGKQIEGHERVWNVPVPSRVTEGPLEFEEIPTDFVTSKETYKFTSFHFANDIKRKQWEFGFWVPIECENPKVFVMETLIAGYR